MSDVELERLLRRWGWCFGGVRPSREVELHDPLQSVGGVDLPHYLRSDSSAVSALDAARTQFVGNPILNLLRRRRFTARGRQTPTRFERRWYPDPQAERVEVAALELWGLNRLMGTVLRAEYCVEGTLRGDKLPRARRWLGMRLTQGQYRVERHHAREWMRTRLSDPLPNLNEHPRDGWTLP